MHSLSTNRFFRVPPATYESIRAGLDAAWGHPRGGTTTCMPPAADAIKDAGGFIIAPVLRTTCEWPEVATTLANLLATGAATETDHATYAALLPVPAPLP